MSSIRITGKKQETYYESHQHEKVHRNYQQEPGRNEEYNFWIKNTVERVKTKLDETEDQIRELENMVERHFPRYSNRRKTQNK